MPEAKPLETAVPHVWLPLLAALNGRAPDGEPGVRDVDAPCEEFQPETEGKPWQFASGDGNCDTDGHHLCAECVHISEQELRRRRDQCIHCGEKLTGEMCVKCNSEDIQRAPVV